MFLFSLFSIIIFAVSSGYVSMLFCFTCKLCITILFYSPVPQNCSCNFLKGFSCYLLKGCYNMIHDNLSIALLYFTFLSFISAKIRRLYDIANVLSSLKLIKKVHVTEERGRKPAFKWTGPEVLPNTQGRWMCHFL